MLCPGSMGRSSSPYPSERACASSGWTPIRMVPLSEVEKLTEKSMLSVLVIRYLPAPVAGG